jgi:hypothetical protein
MIKYYRFHKILGYCIIDNILDNNTTLREISYWLLITHGVIWDRDKYRLYCFGHVVSLIANTFTENKPLKTTRITKAPNTPKTLKADKLA